MTSRLKILMENFAISGKDLSAILHVDSSLVSKWRSGSRSLKPNSVYTAQIIKHVMALDRNNQFAKLRLMLSNEYVNIFKSSESEIAIFLKDWLTSSSEVAVDARDYFDEIRNLKNTSRLTTYSLSGVNGRQQAVLFFLKYAQHISPGAELWMYSTENSKQVNSSQPFVDERTMRLMSLLNDDNHVRIIHTFSGFYEGLATSMLSWMPIHMTGRTTAYFVPKYKDEQIAYTYYLIRDHLALYNWSSVQPRQELNTYLTHEPSFVKDIELVMENHFSQSTRLFTRLGYRDRDEYMNDCVAVMEKSMNEYHWCTSIPIHAIRDEKLRSILTENGVRGAELEHCMENLILLKELGRRTQHCYFIDPDGLRRTLAMDRVCISELSFLCGREISVPRKMFPELMREANEINFASPNVKYCIASTDLLHKLGHIDIVAKENTRVGFAAIDGEPAVMFTTEMTVVTAIYRYFEELWNMTPYICRNKEYVSKRIQKVLDEVSEE